MKVVVQRLDISHYVVKDKFIKVLEFIKLELK